MKRTGLVKRWLVPSLLLASVALLLALRPTAWTPPPAQDGPGPLSLRIDARLVAPDYHSPASWWRTHHPDRVNGGDFAEASCLRCHTAQTYCNQCHRYVGVRLIAGETR